MGVERTGLYADVDMDEHWEQLWSSYAEDELVEFNTWNNELRRTYIGAPTGTLTLHSLAVAPHHRRKGIAHQLIQEAIGRLDAGEQDDLYTETVRKTELVKLFEQNAFVTIRQTLSLSDLFKYGCWGSVLMRYSRGGVRAVSVGLRRPGRASGTA